MQDNDAVISVRERKVLERIPEMDDPKKLQNLIENAKRYGHKVVKRAAFARYCDVMANSKAKEGTVKHDVWRSIYAIERHRKMLGRSHLMSRTRPKIDMIGETATVTDIVKKKYPSDVFFEVLEMGMGHPELLFEAVVLRHRDKFDADTRAIARNRLVEHEIDPEHFTQY